MTFQRTLALVLMVTSALLIVALMVVLVAGLRPGLFYFIGSLIGAVLVQIPIQIMLIKRSRQWPAP